MNVCPTSPESALSRSSALLTAFVATLLAVSLTSCGSGGEKTPPRSQTLQLAAENDVKSLDPAVAYDTQSWAFLRLLYTGLLEYDANAHLIPHGAMSWSASRDGRTYTYHLRRDVHFEGPLTHGRTVTAADYLYEIQRCLDPKVASPGLSFFMGIEGAAAFHARKARTVAGLQTPDPFTLVVHLAKPDPTFPYITALPFTFAVPHEVVEKYGNDRFPDHTEGSGPYRLVHWRRLVEMELERNVHYFQPGVPRTAAIRQELGLEAINQIMMFETGELDISDIPPADFVRVMRSPRFRGLVESRVQMGIEYISLNCEMAPFKDVRVRQAVNYAINRKRLLQLLNGRGILASGVLPPGMPAYDPTMKPYPYDPDKARQLLKAAGCENCSTDLWVRSSGGSGEELREAQSIKQDLDAVGLKITIKPVAFPVWMTAVSQEHRVPMSMNDWMQDFPDPSDFLDVLLNSKQATPSDGNNNAFYKSKAMDALLNQAASMMDPAKRLAIYNRANHLAYQDAPWVFLYYPITFRLRQPWLEDFTLPPVWPAEYEKIRLGPRTTPTGEVMP